MEPKPSVMRTVTCAFCGKETELPAVMADGDLVENGTVMRARLENGKIVREPIPTYHVSCFHAAFGKGQDSDKPRMTDT